MDEHNKNAVIEIAGADSFAAAIRYARENRPEVMLPTIAQTNTTYGDLSVTKGNVELLREHLASQHSVRLLDLEELSDSSLWWAINGRFISVLVEKFGFYTPCIGCHLYLHLVRIPVAKRAGYHVIVAGEREHHDTGVKVNQTCSTLDAYVEVLRTIDVELVLPVRSVGSSKDIRSHAPWLWGEGEQQLRCVLSGNYRNAEGNDTCFENDDVTRFISRFLIPVGARLAVRLVSGNDDYLADIEDVLKGIK